MLRLFAWDLLVGVCYLAVVCCVVWLVYCSVLDCVFAAIVVVGLCVLVRRWLVAGCVLGFGLVLLVAVWFTVVSCFNNDGMWVVFLFADVLVAGWLVFTWFCCLVSLFVWVVGDCLLLFVIWLLFVWFVW